MPKRPSKAPKGDSKTTAFEVVRRAIGKSNVKENKRLERLDKIADRVRQGDENAKAKKTRLGQRRMVR